MIKTRLTVLSALTAAAIICTVGTGVFAQSEEHDTYNADAFGDYVITLYNEKNGLPTGEANVVAQSSDGYVWIGSYGGLIRYDGTQFKNYSEEKDGIKSSSIRSIYEDSAGVLWIGTNDAGVFTYDKSVFTKISDPENGGYQCIRDFTETADGRIYAASSSGLAYIENGVLCPVQAEEIGGTVYCTAADKYGRAWGCMDGGRCVVVNGGEVSAVLSSDMFFDDEESIYCIASDKEGNIYIGGSENGYVKAELKGEGFEKSDFALTTRKFEKVSTLNHINCGNHGRMLVSGLRGFAVVHSDGTVTEFDESLKASSVNSAAEDYEGNMWLASSALGIVKYSKGCFESANAVSGLTDKPINTVVKLDDRFYAGTDDNLYVFDKDWNSVKSPLADMLAGDRIRCMTVSRDKKLWIATYYGHGVVCFDGATGDITCYGADEGLVEQGVRTLLELSDGSVAVGTRNGISIIKDGKITKSYEKDERLTNGTVLCFGEDSDGTLLVGTDGGGIFKINGDSIESFGTAQGLGEGVVLRLLKDSEKSAWFVSAGSSLYYFENGSFTKLENFRKSAGSIFDLTEKNGRIYMMQNNGILSVDKAQLLSGDTARTSIYGVSYGLSGSLNANTWNFIDDSGVMYLSTRSGVSAFDFTAPENPLPIGIINEINVDGKVFSNPVGGIALEQTASRVTIDFSALSYTNTTEFGISYMLDGFDSEPTVLTEGKSGSISYTNLSGGRYSFHLRIFDLADPDKGYDYYVNLNKSKALLEEPVFRICAILLAISAIAGISAVIAGIRIRRAKRRQQEYQTFIGQFLRAFARMIDAKDTYTNGHSIRVARYSREIAKRMKMSEEDQERVFYIALMHDIGKIGIPDSILKKADKLTKEEMEIVKTHPQIGGDILKCCTSLEGIADGARYHHEHYDGSGYCEGIKGKDIPLIARLISVADAYDTMSNARCYRAALETDVIINELKEGAGTQFDPDIVPIMLDMIAEGNIPIDVSESMDY